MAIIPAKTFVNGDPLTAPDLNTYVSGILTSLMNPPSCKAYRSSVQSIPNNTLTPLSFNAELWDSASMHSPSVNPDRITVPQAGVYLVNWFVRMGSVFASAMYFAHRIYHNGAVVDETMTPYNHNASGYTEGVGIAQLKCNANDYIQLYVYQNSGIAVNVDVGVVPSLTVTWLGNG